MSIRAMQNELHQWAAWARGTERNCGVKQYECPTYTMLKQAVGEGRKNGVAVVLDDDALMAVDQLVTALKLSRSDLYAAIHLFYLMGKSVAELAAIAGCARYTIDAQILAAESWLDSRLEILCEMAA